MLHNHLINNNVQSFCIKKLSNRCILDKNICYNPFNKKRKPVVIYLKHRKRNVHMKIFHNKTVLITSFILVTVLGMVLPGILLHMTFSSKLGAVSPISTDLYDTSNSAIAKNASMKLTEYERMKLISGSWESTQTEVDTSSSNISEVEAVELARNTVSELYTTNAYPYHFDSTYDNWYSWETSCYQCIESSFRTYSAYYWKVTFYRYDTDEIHEVLITENGTLLAIRNNKPKETLKSLSSSWITAMNNYYKTQHADAENIIFLDNQGTYRVPTYSHFTIEADASASQLLVINNADVTDLSTFGKMMHSQISDDTEIYHIYHGSDDKNFILYCIPWKE